ncbi:hypothetical protein Pst134EB_010148 [Puccinia striiformis f. sp. tritici]|nr:hypothetical protein Pst134EB_010148 [Puccinia striiformis f. sp. tritici]
MASPARLKSFFNQSRLILDFWRVFKVAILTRRNSNQNNRPHPNTSTLKTTSPPPMDHPR